MFSHTAERGKCSQVNDGEEWQCHFSKSNERINEGGIQHNAWAFPYLLQWSLLPNEFPYHLVHRESHHALVIMLALATAPKTTRVSIPFLSPLTVFLLELNKGQKQIVRK